MQSNGLKKQVGLWSATSIVVGSVIGSGIFMKPATMAGQLGSPVALILVWIIAGVFSLFGALIFAELGAMWPVTGGLYTYFRRIFGDFFSFLYGWSAFAVINTAAIAAISYVCASYADYFLLMPRLPLSTEQSYVWHIPFIGDLYPLQNIGVKAIAILIILGLSWLNYRTVRGGAAFQLISTIIKMLAMAAIVLGIFFSGQGNAAHFFEAGNTSPGTGFFSGVVLAMTGAFLAYDGWINISFVAGEIKEPQRNVPRSLITGVIICIVVYVLVNLAYLYALPIDQMADSPLIATDAVSMVMGTASGALIAAMIVICTLGAVNGSLLATCRVTYAMGRDNLFFRFTGKTSRYTSPGNAIALHAIWTCMFIITGTFDMLADMFVFITWIAYMFGAIGIFILRRRYPGLQRPYRIWGYPWVPLLFIGFSLFYLIFTVRSDISNYLHGRQPVINSFLGLLITIAGIPIYFYLKKFRSGQGDAGGARSSSE